MADEERELRWLGAILGAFRNRDISHYPRFKNDKDEVERISEPEIIEQAGKALDNLLISP